MLPRKIAVITCTNDAAAYAECRRYINALELPAGFELEFVPVTGASGMAPGYNQAMSRTDAKYKVYVHQDVLIVHRDFFKDLIRLFEENPATGLVGVIGGKKIPPSGVWWEAAETVGKIFHSNHGYMHLLDFGNGGDGPWTEVQAVDGLLIATQADLPWQDDLFPGWHFYDASQCLEFLRAGYRIAVPRQQQPWCLHDCGSTPMDEAYRRAREDFYRHYGPVAGRPHDGSELECRYEEQE
jgi:hypothetical protein